MGDRSGFDVDCGRARVTTAGSTELVNEKLRRDARRCPSELCTDDEFLRRVLPRPDRDRCPTVREVRAFLLDARRDGRDEASTSSIERLIGSPEFVEYWTNKWCDLLQCHTRSSIGERGRRGGCALGSVGSIASNEPYDAVRARADPERHRHHGRERPASAFLLRRSNASPTWRWRTTTQLFLGVRFNCNKCHDHPFEKLDPGREHWQLAGVLRPAWARDPRGGRHSATRSGSTDLEAGIEVKLPRRRARSQTADLPVRPLG